MNRLSFSAKIMVMGVLAVVIPLVIVGIFTTVKATSALSSVSEKSVEHIAQDSAKLIDMTLQEEQKLVATLAVDKAIVDTAALIKRDGMKAAENSIKNLYAYLQTKFASMGENYQGIFVTNEEGLLFTGVLQGGKEYKGSNIQKRAYFVKARDTKLPVIGDLVRSKTTGKLIVVPCAPILSKSGDFLGTVGIPLKVDFLTDIVTAMKVGKTGEGSMVNAEGQFIANADASTILNLNLKDIKGAEAITEKILSGETGVGSYMYNGAEKIGGYAPVHTTGWKVIVGQDKAEFLSPARAISIFVIGVGAFFLLATIAGCFLVSRRITRPISHSISMIENSVIQVASGLSQITVASQTLSEGASNSAASVEETSSSLEEMSSMTKQNASNAHEADRLMNETIAVVETANDSMQALTNSMKEISAASEETSKIIKTIDEIAFQTNLLALNAAVEAARAGEAGAGFAVVAEEVRNLAMRAADAAKNTGHLIEATVKKIAAGSAIMEETNKAFHQVSASASKVDELLGEISGASQEQAQGIEQINKAIIQIDKVTQQTAEGAEESAATAAELNSHALQTRNFVYQLHALLNGGGANGNTASSVTTSTKTMKTVSAPPPKALPLHRPATSSKPESAMSAAPSSSAISSSAVKDVMPEDIIPLGDDDFSDF